MEPIAYLNGSMRPASECTIALHDTGFVQGITVAEQLRTFHGRLFQLDEHLRRLAQSLSIVGIELPIALSELAAVAQEVVARNFPLLSAGSDLGLGILVTPGPYAAFAPPDADNRPTLCVHSYPLAFRIWSRRFHEGQALVTTPVRQVPNDCWPTELKCRSRMHYFLADRAAQQREAGARALMLDHEGFVTEASTANLVIFTEQDGLLSPPREKILPGISVAVLEQLAQSLGIPFRYRNLTINEVTLADESYLTSTSPCILPVSRVNGIAPRSPLPGPTYERLLQAWSSLVGLDIAGQARSHSTGPAYPDSVERRLRG